METYNITSNSSGDAFGGNKIISADVFIETLNDKIFPGYVDCENLIESNCFKENVRNTEEIDEKLIELQGEYAIYYDLVRRKDEIVDFAKEDINSIMRDQVFFSNDYMISNDK